MVGGAFHPYHTAVTTVATYLYGLASPSKDRITAVGTVRVADHHHHTAVYLYITALCRNAGCFFFCRGEEMFLSDFQPIVFNLPRDMAYADIYFIHDLHFGVDTFDEKKWKALKSEILANDHAYVCWIGDLMENAIPNSKSDPLTQKHPPAVQKEWVVQQFKDFGGKTIAVVPGNHEHNRTTKMCGLYPLYDCCLLAGIDDKYRDTIAFIDIAIGMSHHANKKQIHYYGQIQHKAKDAKAYCSADYTDGIDFFAYGHDHEPKDKPRAKLVFDSRNSIVYKRNVECIDNGSCCAFGGYGAKEGYRPQSDKMYKLRIFSGKKKMETTGFYL